MRTLIYISEDKMNNKNNKNKTFQWNSFNNFKILSLLKGEYIVWLMD